MSRTLCRTALRRTTTFVLFMLAALATLTMWTRDPFPAWAYSFGALLLGATVCLKGRICWGLGEISLAAIVLWGFGQLATRASAYPWATWNAALAYAGLGATALVSADAFTRERLRMRVLRGFVWFAFTVTLVSAVAHYWQVGEASDAWGPFLNRNHFAVFLELALPVSLWLGAAEPVYTVIAAIFLAAGVATASRAGAVLLLVEAALVGILLPGPRRMLWRFGVTGMALLALTGVGRLGARLAQPDPFQYRREIARSALAMLEEHPWRGFGLGTFRTVYPAYAEFDAGKTVDHAHDDWLEWAVEGGLPFALAWAALLVRLVPAAVRSIWGIGVVAVFVHASVDYPFARIGLTAWVFVLIGGLLRGSRRARPGKSSCSKFRSRPDRARSAVAAGMALLLAGSGTAPSVMGGMPSIGTVTAAGSFRVNHATVYGNATLFEGSRIETNTAISSLELANGRVRLAAFSEARVFRDRLRLERGAGEIEIIRGIRPGRFEVAGGGVTVAPATHDGAARVTLGDGGRVTVVAFSGSFRAMNERGLVIANLRAGSVLAFDPQPAGAPARVTGCLTSRRGHFLITDETTNVEVEVAGKDLKKEVGNRVEITGTGDGATTPAAEASQYIRVLSVKRLSKGCGKSSAVPAGSDRAGANATGTGATGGQSGTDSGGTPAGKVPVTTIAIIGGVAVAAVVGGLAAAGRLPGRGNPAAGASPPAPISQ